jgi:ABC-type polysaccharide/polyol phosphate transport system ATPase subunit
MSSDIAIKVDHLTKIYKLYESPADRLKEALNPLRRKYHRDFHALSDVSFEIRKGETVGIIGQNGAGKSTLLKMITGVLTPTSGQVRVEGRISALLELGAGFNPDISGMENLYFNGTL